MLGLSSPNEWLIILAIVLIIFGGKKIPELMGGLGKGVKNFKKGINDAEESAKETTAQIEAKGEGTEVKKQEKAKEKEEA